MKAKQKFKIFYIQMPVKARKELVYNFSVNPMTLVVCWAEVANNTKLGKKILQDLGFEDD